MNNSAKIKDIISALVFMALSVFVYVEAMDFGNAAAGTSDSGIFPKAVACILFFLSVLLIVRTIVKSKVEGKHESGNKDKIPKNSIFILLLTVLYTAASAIVGILIPIPFFVCGCLLVLGYRKPLGVALISILSALIVYAGFDLLLGIPLI